MSADESLEEVEPTRTEKVLALVLAIFLLIASAWLYIRIGDWLPANPSEGELGKSTGYDAGNDVAATLLRLGFLLAWLVVAVTTVLRMRSVHSRFLPLGWAGIVVGALLACAFTGDYAGRWLGDFAPLIIAVLGAGISIATFWRIQRYLALRVPLRRVRKGDCPFCGYPARHILSYNASTGRECSHCEGCGRAIVANCTACGSRRRVGAAFCVSCGTA